MTDATIEISGDDNPFLEQLNESLATDDLERRLIQSPLSSIDVRELSKQARLDLLDRMQVEMFEPTSTSLQIVTHEFRLIRRGLLLRNPCKSTVRNKTMMIAGLAKQELSRIPWFTTFAKGMRVSGETGTGKSYEITRGLDLLPQIIIHKENRAAGWTHIVQVVWLYVAMSHDGSLGGLLLNILCALDAAAGTTYSTTKSIIGLSNEKLAVHIGIILRNHGVGVLVIDELQSRNFSGGAHGALAAMFFLRMLNFGIPIILIGNPFGMDALDRFSQDMRRIGSGGSFDMRPLAADDFDWVHCLVPALWGYDVMPEPTEIKDPDGLVLFMYSGGIRDYACRIRVASQRVALDLGATAVTLDHMEQAFWGPDFGDKDRALIAGFRDKNPISLQAWEDVRWQDYAERWGYFQSSAPGTDAGAKDSSADQGGKSDAVNPPNADGSSSESPKPKKTANERDMETIKRNRTRKASALTQQTETRSALQANDLRHTGLQEYLIAGFEALRKGKEQSPA